MIRFKKVYAAAIGIAMTLSISAVTAKAEPITELVYSQEKMETLDDVSDFQVKDREAADNEVLSNEETGNYIEDEKELENNHDDGEEEDSEIDEQKPKEDDFQWINIHGRLFYYVNGIKYNEPGWFKEKDININADENNIYYFDEDGLAVTGWFEIDGNQYYFNEAGIRQTGWTEVDGIKYYFDEDGIMQKGWIHTDNGSYYLDDEGNMLKGRQYIDGNWYLFGVTGQLMIGRYYNTEGKLCYSNVKGIIPYDKWVTIGSDKYYVKSDGTLAVGKVILDGKVEEFDSAGKHEGTEDINIPYIYVKTLNVGDADCIFIKLPNGETALIDTGLPATASKVVEFLNGQNLKKGKEKDKIDYILITHGHSDHIGGLRTILDNFEVGKVYMPAIAKMKDWYSEIHETEENRKDIEMLKYDYEVYKDAEEAMCQHNKKFTNTVKGQYMDKGKVLKFIQSDAFFGPAGDDELTKDFWGINNNSAIVYLSYGDLQMLFTGDMEWTAEHNFCFNNLLEGNKVDVLKVPHHGNDTSSTEEFLQNVNPQIGIVSRAEESIVENSASVNLSKQAIRLYETSSMDGVDIYGTATNWTVNINNTVKEED